MKIYLMLAGMLSCISADAQQTIHISDRTTHKPLPFTTIIADSTLITTADSTGSATLTLTDGPHHLRFIVAGYRRSDTTLLSPFGFAAYITMVATEKELEEVTVIASSRNGQEIENSPLKVEVLGATEISEEAGIKPGNIASILGDVSGVQIQQSSVTSGNSNVRIQGLDGRYTQILRDGMPLYDGFAGGFGILTIPPLDLKQIELIKGSASTLYGGGAIGGLVNLISKRPTNDQTIDALINYTTLKELNANLYLAKRYERFGYTMFGGYTNQQAVDVDKDGLSDLPQAGSFLLHPRLYYYPSARTTVSIGYSGTFDDRKGGDMQVLDRNTTAVHQYYERNNTQRHTGEYLAEHSFRSNVKLTLKGTASNFDREITTNTYGLHGNQTSYFNEASVFVPMGDNNMVAGINVSGDDYHAINTPAALLQQYGNITTGAFAQYSLHIKERTIIDAGFRLDHHNVYGLRPLPRIAAFHRFSSRWAGRTGFGMGYKVPNPLVQQNIDLPLLQIAPVRPDMVPELSYGYNAEVNYKKEWDNGLTLFVNEALFYTRIARPIVFAPSYYGSLIMANVNAPVNSMGSDTYVKLGYKKWELYLGYTYTSIRYTYMPDSISFAPLTPRNRCAMVLAREIEEKWRIGLEASYTGRQYRYDATTTPGYAFIAMMVQRNIGSHMILVLNCENLLDYRMSNVERLYTGSISNPAFKPLWAPIDGRVVNLSVRWKL